MSRKVRVWVDTDSGTWGDPSKLRFVELEVTALNKFADASDEDRIDEAQKWGTEAIDLRVVRQRVVDALAAVERVQEILG